MKYQKSSGNREPSAPKTHLNQPDSAEIYNNESEDLSSDNDLYSKAGPVVEARLFFVLVEGEKKEVDYLKYLQGDNKYSNLRIISFPMSNAIEFDGNVADKIAEAIEKIKITNNITLGGERVNFTEIDSLYVIIDVDDLYEQIKNNQKKGDIATWIISNPCFEIWLYYSFHDTPDKDFNLHNIDSNKRSQELKKQLNIVHRGGIGCRQAFENIQNACVNSKKNYTENPDGMPALYSTNMHNFAMEIYNTIEYEYNERKRIRQERISKFNQSK